MSKSAVKWALVAIGVVALLVTAAQAAPVPLWRTGEVPQPELQHSPPERDTLTPARVWIDADAACGTGKRCDPDDCLALLSLASARHINIAGISTVFGNAPVSETDPVMRALVQELGTYAGRPVEIALPVFRGCGAAAEKCLEDGGSVDAQAGLRQALQRGNLEVVVLGPLTNLAALLTHEPALASRITRVIAVMGRRPGHRFHPSENRASGAMLFGHGPVFRDLNAVLDPQAVAVVLSSGIPVALVPYTAARQVSMTGGDLDRIALAGPAGRWVAERSRAWLEFWRSEAGLDGSTPSTSWQPPTCAIPRTSNAPVSRRGWAKTRCSPGLAAAARYWWHSKQFCPLRQRPRHRRSTATWCAPELTNSSRGWIPTSKEAPNGADRRD